MVAVSTSETSTNLSEATQRNIPQYLYPMALRSLKNLDLPNIPQYSHHIRRRENLKSHLDLSGSGLSPSRVVLCERDSLSTGVLSEQDSLSRIALCEQESLSRGVLC
jgi:hypothetical protein